MRGFGILLVLAVLLVNVNEANACGLFRGRTVFRAKTQQATTCQTSPTVQTAPIPTPPVTPVPPPAKKQESPAPVTTVVVELHDHVNAARIRAGLHMLVFDHTLQGIAQRWAEHMAATGRFAHGGGEQVIAMGQTSPSGVFTSWMNSPGHQAWLMSTSQKAGWGFATGANGVTYWAGAFDGMPGATSGCSGASCNTVTRSRFRFFSR